MSAAATEKPATAREGTANRELCGGFVNINKRPRALPRQPAGPTKERRQAATTDIIFRLLDDRASGDEAHFLR